MLLDGLTGQESEGHDCYNLLDRWGLLEHDTQIARWMRMIAFLMCVGSIAIAAGARYSNRASNPVTLRSLDFMVLVI
jgi:hypothetical protein